ncbi:hypothetical protein HOLleu_21395 [Holothuria leucospilota]|uniref:Uncharacterized protein n=1 Tax=Holothuria leucospilota TaxID=206669 RepID=A0A9Q1BXR9_HOLLE|nr:hypothetical protein HOLleu_21395 [Holothuria leucospilota]
MAESKELMDQSRMTNVDVPFDLEEGTSMERTIETVKSSLSSLSEKLNPGSTSHPTQIVAGNNSNAISQCNFNITNIYGGGALQNAPCPLPSSSVYKPEGARKQFASDSQPSPRWIEPEKEMLLRVVPVAAEIQQWSDVMILTVWLCWDDDKTFHNLIKCEHENGNVTLDSYDTFILKRSDSAGFQKDDCINIRLETNEENTWQPSENLNNIVSVQVWSANKAKCSFRLKSCKKRRDKSQLYVTLRVFQNSGTGHSESKFILRKRTAELQVIQKQKDMLLNILDTSSSADSDNAGGFSLTCMAIPYVDSMLHLNDDIVVTLWLCWCDGKRQALETLKKEQKIYSRVLLDTENSFVIGDTEEVLVTDMLQNGHYKIVSGPQTVQPRRVSHGMRAKFQFISRKVKTRSEYILKESRQGNHINTAEIRQKLISGEIREDEDNLFSTKEHLDVKLITKQEKGMQIDFQKIKELSCFLLGKERDSSISAYSWKEKRVHGGFPLNNLSRRWGRFYLPKWRCYIFMVMTLMTLVCLCFVSDVGDYLQSQLFQHQVELPDIKRIFLLSIDASTEAVKKETWRDFTPYFVAKLDTNSTFLLVLVLVIVGLHICFGNKNEVGLRYNTAGNTLPNFGSMKETSQIIWYTSKTYLNRLRGHYSQDTRRGAAEVGDGAILPVTTEHGMMKAAKDVPEQALNICVLRIHLLLSYKEESDSLVFKLLFSKVSSTSNEHDLILSELSHWTLADSSDTLLLQTSPTKKEGAPVVKASFEAHHSSYWTPVVCEKIINVEEIMEGEVVQWNCSLTKSHSESENGRVYVTVRVMQKHKTRQREVQFVIRKTIKDVKKLIEERRNTSSLPTCPMMDWEYQTCLIMPYLDLMKDTNDDIILTVWMCSIQQSTQEFYALKNEQRRFSRVQLDTENSFVFSNMDTPITAIVSVLKGSLEQMELIKEIEPLQIKEGQRAKFQFVCKGIFHVVDLRISILQKGESNKVEFMARKKVKLFLQKR